MGHGQPSQSAFSAMPFYAEAFAEYGLKRIVALDDETKQMLQQSHSSWSTSRSERLFWLVTQDLHVFWTSSAPDYGDLWWFPSALVLSATTFRWFVAPLVFFISSSPMLSSLSLIIIGPGNKWNIKNAPRRTWPMIIQARLHSDGIAAPPHIKTLLRERTFVFFKIYAYDEISLPNCFVSLPPPLLSGTRLTN